MKRIIILLTTLFLLNNGYAQETPADSINTADSVASIKYSAPKWYEFASNIPGDFAVAGKTLVSKKSLVPVLTVAGSTAALYLLDQKLVDGVQQFSRYIGLDATSNFETLISIGDLKVMERPGNLNTAFYFIGEGWSSILIFGGIGAYGAITNNEKELRIVSQAFEGYIEIGVVTQILKRSFGRETPRNATVARGKFRPFPSFSEYQHHTPTYDAMPSGHMVTMSFTVTLLAEHYPDNRWIRPVGYSLISICAFSMLNNGVHWASDYPLGFGIGYLFAKTVAKRGRVFEYFTSKPDNILNQVELSPAVMFDGSLGVKLALNL